MTWWIAATAIAKATTAPVLQLAADGAWETARVIGAEEAAVAAQSALEQIASTATRDVAVEVLWPGQSFVGVRWRLDDVDAALAGVGAAAAALQARPGPTPATALLTLLGAEPSPQADLVQLGAVNAWASVGPETLWQQGQHEAARVRDLPSRRPDLTSCRHPLAVEIAASEPRPCWVGIGVSRPAGALHLLDLAAVADLLPFGAERRS